MSFQIEGFAGKASGQYKRRQYYFIYNSIQVQPGLRSSLPEILLRVKRGQADYLSIGGIIFGVVPWSLKQGTKG